MDKHRGSSVRWLQARKGCRSSARMKGCPYRHASRGEEQRRRLRVIDALGPFERMYRGNRMLKLPRVASSQRQFRSI